MLGTTLTVDRLKQRGYVSLLEIYKRTSPQLNGPLYTRPVRTACPVECKAIFHRVNVRGFPPSVLTGGAAYSIVPMLLIPIYQLLIILLNDKLVIYQLEIH